MKAVDVVVATGGGAMVKSAYSSGKPSYGVGAGNVPVVIDRGVDLEDAAEKILRYFSSTSTEQISPDSAGRFTSFNPVGFAIFATLFDAGQATPGRFMDTLEMQLSAASANANRRAVSS